MRGLETRGEQSKKGGKGAQGGGPRKGGGKSLLEEPSALKFPIKMFGGLDSRTE